MLTCRIGNITVGRNAPPVRLMAVINTSPPESFFSKSFVPPESVFSTAQRCADDGADIIDIGARSTAPNAPVIPVETERERVTDVLKQIDGLGDSSLS